MKFTDPEQLQIEYRNAYLEALDLEVPEAFEELSVIASKYKTLLNRADGKPFGAGFLDERFLSWNKDIFEDSPGRIYAQLTDDWEYYGINAKRVSKTVRQLETDFIQFISEWKEFIDRYFLNDGWLEGHARVQLKFRYKFGEAIKGFSSTGIFQESNIWQGKPLEFSFPGMRLNTTENAKPANRRYKQAAIKAFRSYLDEHIVNTDKYFKETLNFTQNTNPHQLKYVGWLVLWNTNQMTKSQIERMTKKERTDLNRRFLDLERIGLPYRREGLTRTKNRA